LLFAAFIVLLSLHLLAVNTATAGPLVALWFDRRGRKHEDGPASWIAGQLIRHSIAALAIGIALGLAAGFMLWLADRERITAAIYALPYGRLRDGVWELAFYFVCLVLYLPLSRSALRKDATGVFARIGQWILVLAAVSNLAYHFPFLFSVLSQTRTASSDDTNHVISVAEMLSHWKQSAFIAQFVHFLLASVATAGVVVMCLSMRLEKLGVDESDQWRIGIYGARIAAVPSVLQLAVGTYFLLSLPQGLQGALMGDSLLATSLFGVSLLAALALMHRLVGISLGLRSRASVVQSAVLLIVTVMLMTASLHAARSAVTAS
jgi:hypothetical protein